MTPSIVVKTGAGRFAKSIARRWRASIGGRRGAAVDDLSVEDRDGNRRARKLRVRVLEDVAGEHDEIREHPFLQRPFRCSSNDAYAGTDVRALIARFTLTRSPSFQPPSGRPSIVVRLMAV